MVDAYSRDILGARAQGDDDRVQRLEQHWDIQERGIYVLVFAQFEVAVTEVFQRAHDARRSNPDWRIRRGWDFSQLHGRRLPFETKLALVMDSHRAEYREVRQAYELRNHCAHGGMTRPIGSIEDLIHQVYHWQSLLRA